MKIEEIRRIGDMPSNKEYHGDRSMTNSESKGYVKLPETVAGVTIMFAAAEPESDDPSLRACGLYRFYDENFAYMGHARVVDFAGWPGDPVLVYVSVIHLEKTRTGFGFKFYEWLLERGVTLMTDDEHTRFSEALWSKLAKTHTVRVAMFDRESWRWVIGDKVTDTSVAYAPIDSEWSHENTKVMLVATL